MKQNGLTALMRARAPESATMRRGRSRFEILPGDMGAAKRRQRLINRETPAPLP